MTGERWGSYARGDAGLTWTGAFMALLLGAAAGAAAFGAAWVGLRLVGCPATLVKALAVLAGLGVAAAVTLRLLGRERRGDGRWRDSVGLSEAADVAERVAEVVADVLD
jgi:hypothetical protein